MSNSSKVKRSDENPAWEQMLLHMQVMLSVLHEAEEPLAELGLDPKTFFVLTVLDEFPSPADIASALVTPRPTVTSLVKKAEKNGFIERRTVPDDLRRFHLSLTPAGRKAMLSGRRILNHVYGERLAQLTARERAALPPVLEKLAGPCWLEH